MLSTLISPYTKFTDELNRVSVVPPPHQSWWKCSGRVTKLDVAKLVPTVASYSAGLAESTQRVYKSGILKYYKDFCELVERDQLPTFQRWVVSVCGIFV